MKKLMIRNDQRLSVEGRGKWQNRLFRVFSLLMVAVFGSSALWAQLSNLEVGKVYHFTNKRYPDRALGLNESKLVRGVTPVNKSDYNQLWVVAGKDASGNFRLQNLGNGGYLQPKGKDTEWLLVNDITADTYLVLGKTGSNNVFRGKNQTGDYVYANVAGGHNYKIFGWTHVGDDGSQWTIADAGLDQAAINKILDDQVRTNDVIRNAVTEALGNLFTDAACTTAKKSLTVAQLEYDADYQTLTPTLRNMAKKVYGSSWAENNYNSAKDAWDNDYAKKYRVQWYEPYTEPECAAAALRINAHTNLNNPTGIFANNGDLLFIMVEGEIKEGAYLYLASYRGHDRLGGYSQGTELHTGLNVIPVDADGTNYCINYVVKTFDTSKGTGKNAIIQGRELSKYPDLQIHIEGGYINGYWNKMGDANHNGDFNYPADTDADWNYIKERATQTDVTVLGEYITLQFPLTDEGTVDDKGMGTFFNSYKGKTTSLSASLEEWDNVMAWERLLMGVVGKNTNAKEDKKSPYSNQPSVIAFTGEDTDGFGCDYGEYYRIHGLSFGTEGGYMYGSWDHCGYNFNTMESIMVDITTSAGSHWGPAHEIGHQHQGPLNMRGLTEVTNNLFSNVVLWYYGESTSRYNGDEGSLTNVLQQFNAEGTDFFSNNIWGQTIMYYKLFMYYHVLGHNPKFYPRLFEMLRQDPMTIEYDQDGGKSLMHFYKLCCDAAGEDLTEFFRAHGFFRVMEQRFVGDYSNAIYNMTQAQIDQAIADVKEKKYPVNLSVLFINDATGETIKSHKGDNLEQYGETTICSEIGGYASFATATAPSYNYTISGNTVTMNGAGGIGFAILNEKGELVGFSDKKNFAISAEAMGALSNGEATIATITAKGDIVAATSTMHENEIKRTLLDELVKQAEALNGLVDDEGKKVGFYKSSYTTDLNAALIKAKEVISSNTVSAYTAVYNSLKTAIDDLKSKEFAKITMKPGTYTLRNFAYPERHLSVNGSNEVVTTTNGSLSNTEKWVFEQGDGNNVYYIKNLNTGMYINALEQSKVVSATTSAIANAKGWLVEDLGNGVLALTCQDENNQAIHSSANDNYKIVGWNTGAPASHWYLTALETEQLSAEQQKLEELIVLSEDMLGRVANVETTKVPVNLTANSYYCNAPHSYGNDGLTSYAVLYDNNYATYLHTDYSGADSKDGLDHYLRVDLGKGNSASLFTFNYASRESNLQNPTTIIVEGSNEAASQYEFIAELTREEDMLITNGNAEYHSAILGLSDKSYRYLRFTVTGTIQGAAAGPAENKHVFFVVSEFGVSKTEISVTPLAKYTTLNSEEATAAYNAIRQAKYAYIVAESEQDYTNAYNALKGYYDTLNDAYEAGNQAALADKKEELKSLMEQTEELIANCGTITATWIENAALQTSNPNANFYVSTNADQNTGGGGKDGDGIAALVDNNESTYFHTRWGGTKVNEPHYFQVDLGEELRVNDFEFGYKPRNGSPAPTAMTVYGSNDGENFTDVLATITEDLPAHDSGKSYRSRRITSEKAYRYLRFTVTQSAGPGNTQYGGQYFFGMLEFDLSYSSREDYTIQLNDDNIGQVTEEILFATYQETKEAEAVYTYATTEAQLEKAISNLNEQYEALLEAYNKLNKTPLLTLAEQIQALVDGCYETPGDVDTFKYSNSLYVTESLLNDVQECIDAAQEVYNDETVTKEAYDEAYAALEETKASLEYALNHALLPVMVTTDMTKPNVYAIKIKRTDTSVLAYDAESKMVAVANDYNASEAQWWYFIDNVAKDGKVLMLPYSGKNTSLVLASNDHSEGHSKVQAVAKDASGYVQEWSIVANANNAGWYNITCLNNSGSTFYFSNYWGPNYKMGFYNSATDDGSLFSFVTATVTQTQTEALTVTGKYNVKLERNFTPGWSTICLPFATTVDALGAAEAQEYTGASDAGLTFARVTNLQANVPYLVKFDEEVVEPYFAGVTVEKATPSAVTYGDWQFDGTYTGIVAPNMEGLYGVTTAIEEDGETYQALRRGSNKASIKGTRAYFRYTGNQNVQQMRLVLNGTTTGIGSIQDGKVTISKFPADIYSLDGRIVRRMANDLEGLSKGVYIINGEKVLVK